MKFNGYYKEMPQNELHRKLKVYNTPEQKVDIWNAFVESDLSDVTGDDFSILPRVLPASYWPVIKRSAYLITKFTMRLLSLPEKEIRAIIPKGPIRDHLIEELEVLHHRNGRITGSFRFDMAIVGPPERRKAPYLLEINEIGFDGLARSSFFQKTLLEYMPDLRGRLRSLDTAAAEVRNMQRLGNRIARLQYDNYNWDEEYLLRTGDRLGSEIRLICPSQFGLAIDKDDFPQLEKKPVRFKNNRVVIGQDWKPDAINMSFAYSMEDYLEGHNLYKKLMQARTPQYGPFLTGLVAAKTILVLMDDPPLRKKLLGSSKLMSDSILPAQLLSDPEVHELLKRPQDWVLKHTDGCGGEQVFLNQDVMKRISKIPARERHEWVLQKKTQLNLIDVNGLLSKPKQAISDLGVFVQYDWAKDRFLNFEVGGLMCRATNKSLKVNVSGGGLQVAVLLDRAR
ncbi:MAG: hypothetical protein ACAH59_02030 [Pseudobdellovibrionaceae bacterium]